MPWTAPEFRRRHAQHLTGNQAKEAAKMANGMLKSGAPEGTAIATAIKHVETHSTSGLHDHTTEAEGEGKSYNAKSRSGKTRSWSG
jgi:uncharacterized protein YdaT